VLHSITPERISTMKTEIEQKIEEESSFTLTVNEEIRDFLREAITEDKGPGDITTIATIPPNKMGNVKVVVKETGVLCGSQLFAEVFELVNETIDVKCWASEGQTLSRGRTVFTINGPLGAILTAERVALNMLGILSGIATTTSEHVKAIRHTKARITDTRKTTPMLRRFEKYAVRVGGGTNHRMGLYDMIVIKDNHVDSCGSIHRSGNAQYR